MNPHDKFMRERRMAFLKAENELRKNPNYDRAQAEIIDKSVLAGWGRDELKSIYEEYEANEAKNGGI